MLVAAAVLPHPPLLVPELAAGAAAELDELRAACARAVAAVASSAPDVTYLVGVDSLPHARSFAPWGADVAVDVPEPLPLSLLVGGLLTTGTGRSFVVVADDLTSAQCADLGGELASSAGRVALLVMGDSTARLSEKAPGYLDERAAGYDDAVAGALGRADTAALLALEPQPARDLMAAGRAPWQVLAGAADGLPSPTVEAGWRGAPYGVSYQVFTWKWQENA